MIVAMVLVAGGIGAVTRAAIGVQWNRRVPWGTLVVNLAASFALGLISDATGWWVEVVSIGLLGALSTWSSLVHEVTQLVRLGRTDVALGYLGGTVTAGIGLAWLGLLL